MDAKTFAGLLLLFGPGAIQLIQQLVALWSKPALTVDEVMALCATAQKSYDQYLAEARAALPLAQPGLI